MLSSKDLIIMSKQDICEIDPSTLVDISKVFIDSSLPQTERVKRYLAQIHNPYCFKSGDTPVRIRFTGSEKSLSSSLVEYFSRVKQK
jgi:hypothetical protein